MLDLSPLHLLELFSNSFKNFLKIKNLWGENQLISKSQNYDVFDRVWICVLFFFFFFLFLPEILSNQLRIANNTHYVNKSKHTYFYKSSVRFTAVSAFLLVVHFTPVGWAILPQSFGIICTTQWICISHYILPTKLSKETNFV